MSIARKILQFIRNLPPIKARRLATYRQKFFAKGSRWPRFHGLFASRADAETYASAQSELVGYDHSEIATVSMEAMSEAWTSDFPVLFWMAKSLHSTRRLFDLGGHVGTKYRAWRSRLELPEAFVWTVCDLPELVEQGRRLSEDLPQLEFTTRFEDAEGSDVLLASGVLQYADFDLKDLLETLQRRPQHLLINKLPTHASPDQYTLENLHYSVVPYRVFDEKRFLQGIVSLGYELMDRWIVYESSVRVPFTTLGEPTHHGFYFRKIAR
ncbi:MAG: methyltransferase, TIGR04325 family [Pseudomonadota bacterium]